MVYVVTLAIKKNGKVHSERVAADSLKELAILLAWRVMDSMPWKLVY